MSMRHAIVYLKKHAGKDLLGVRFPNKDFAGKGVTGK